MRRLCTAREIDAWLALWGEEPRLEARDDLRTAHQTLVLGNLILGAAGAKKRLRLEDVLIRFRDFDREFDPERAIQSVMAALRISAQVQAEE